MINFLVMAKKMKMMKESANDHYDERQAMTVRNEDDSEKQNELRTNISFLFEIILASQDSDYCTEDLNLMNETDVW